MQPTAGGASDADHGSTHAHVRRATAEQHRRLDSGLAYVLSEHLPTDRYVDLLGALFGFYAPLENLLACREAAGPPPGLALIRRADLLRQDLRAFGRAPEHIPTCGDIPAFMTQDHAAGAIYVVEGASLGGQVIARRLKQCHGIGPENGSAFFTGDGAHISARWKQVVAWLDERGRGAAAREEIAAGACRTFAALVHWLDAREVLDE
jgi:heme oxygenase